LKFLEAPPPYIYGAYGQNQFSSGFLKFVQKNGVVLPAKTSTEFDVPGENPPAGNTDRPPFTCFSASR
jgi:hypothetical protein